EWFGYVLSGDMRQHKMMFLVGPPRSGKGVIARVKKQLMGERNVCSPRLADFAQQFGLQPLLGKSLAIVADARLSGRHDAVPIVEALLGIIGEDEQTTPRKYKDSVVGKLLVRFMMSANEVPELPDSSKALYDRM